MTKNFVAYEGELFTVIAAYEGEFSIVIAAYENEHSESLNG